MPAIGARSPDQAAGEDPAGRIFIDLKALAGARPVKRWLDLAFQDCGSAIAEFAVVEDVAGVDRVVAISKGVLLGILAP